MKEKEDLKKQIEKIAQDNGALLFGVADISKIKDEINKQEKDKEISEDEKYNLIEKLDEMVKDYSEQIKELGAKKEAEISV